MKTIQLMLYREIIAVCSQIHTKHINTLCGQNVELLVFKYGTAFRSLREVTCPKYSARLLTIFGTTDHFQQDYDRRKATGEYEIFQLFV
jgi:hypothetical protein